MKYFILASLFFSSTALTAQIPCVDGMSAGYPCSNIALMSQFDLIQGGGGNNFNDIWGWTDPESGHEYALLGRSTGTSFIDITDPTNPVVVGDLPSVDGGSSLWRDIKVFNNHAFIVSEQGGHGMQVYDLTQLSSISGIPATLEPTAYYDGFGNSHNIAINEETGFAYAVGTSTFDGGLHVIDISDPVNPVLAGGYSESGYTHDAQIVNYKGPDQDYFNREIVFACNGNKVAIADCTEKTDIQTLSTIDYTDLGYTHQGWLTEDHHYFLVNDETDELSSGFNTHTHVFDVSDLQAPVYVGFYEHAIASSDHNLYISGNTAYMSNYTGGLRVMDISGVATANMTEIAYFDVYTNNNDAGFSGTWSNYPYFESGNIVISGFDGFWVVKVDEGVIVTDIEDVPAAQAHIFPNPVKDVLKIQIEGVSNLNYQINDISGKTVLSQLNFPMVGETINLNVENLPAGLYVVSFPEMGIAPQRIVKD